NPAKLLELPKPLSWSTNLLSMRQARLLQTNSQHQHAGRTSVHLLGQELQGVIYAFHNFFSSQRAYTADAISAPIVPTMMHAATASITCDPAATIERKVANPNSP